MAVAAGPRRPEPAGRAAACGPAPEPGAGGGARRIEPAVPGVPGEIPGPAQPGRAQAARRRPEDHAGRAARRRRRGPPGPPPPRRPAGHQQALADRMPSADRSRRRRTDRVRDALGPGRAAGQFRRGGRHHRDQDGRGYDHRRSRRRAGRARGRSPRRGALPGLERPGPRARRTVSPTRPSCTACSRTLWSGRGQAASARSTCASSPARSPAAASRSADTAQPQVLAGRPGGRPAN